MNPYRIAFISNRLNWLINCLPSRLAVKFHSWGRAYFMQQFYQAKAPPVLINFDNSQQRTLWGIDFRYPLLNAAGMFKNGEGYDLVARQGAGGYIAGTTTANSRIGNIKHKIKHPFITLPDSAISINYLGLPNLGDTELYGNPITQDKAPGCPIGWSLMRSSDLDEVTGLALLIDSLFKYQSNLLIDFIEINESCPNVSADFNNLSARLEYISNNFLLKRERRLPVIIKLSNDTSINLLPKILDMLFKYKFDGVNIGNTSIKYTSFLPDVVKSEQKLFCYFTKNFGGGVGGNLLKDISLNLCKAAVAYRNWLSLDYEFHVIRTGGISCYADIEKSNDCGIALNQWYTGYFKNYIKQGDLVYKKFWDETSSS